MPFVNVKLIKGVFNAEEKQDMISKLTDTMVSIEGEAMRQVTWVVIEEVASGDWGDRRSAADDSGRQGARGRRADRLIEGLTGRRTPPGPTAPGDRYDLPAEDAEMSDRIDQRPAIKRV